MRNNIQEVLSALSLISIKLGDIEYSRNQIANNWIGFEPATPTQIESSQNKLALEFPDDYVGFLEITNGLSTPNQVEPSFMQVEQIEYLKKVYPLIVEIWSAYEPLLHIGEQLQRSIIVGGKDEEQYFLLIPPKVKEDNWKYWTFSSWGPGETEYSDLKSYFQHVLEFNEQRRHDKQ